MNSPVPTPDLIRTIEASEIEYMTDRMTAIQGRLGNPEGIEIRPFGNAFCYYSKTMPWPSFNTVKGLRSEDIDSIEPILDFYRTRERKPQFEIVPSAVDSAFLRRLAENGCYPSGTHTSLWMAPGTIAPEPSDRIRIEELREDQFELYARIHCRGTGLSDDGIPHVAANNRVLYGRPGWKFYVAFLDEEPAAAGVLRIRDGIASLTFAATLPEYRNMGLQRRLLLRRLEEAGRQSCSLAVGQCAFLSASHRNMERVGMKIGYVRTSWTLL